MMIIEVVVSWIWMACVFEFSGIASLTLPIDSWVVITLFIRLLFQAACLQLKVKILILFVLIMTRPLESAVLHLKITGLLVKLSLL